MNDAMKGFVERMTNADQVKITGPGTDLRFSIKGIKALVAVVPTIFLMEKCFLARG